MEVIDPVFTQETIDVCEVKPIKPTDPDDGAIVSFEEIAAAAPPKDNCCHQKSDFMLYNIRDMVKGRREVLKSGERNGSKFSYYYSIYKSPSRYITSFGTVLKNPMECEYVCWHTDSELYDYFNSQLEKVCFAAYMEDNPNLQANMHNFVSQRGSTYDNYIFRIMIKERDGRKYPDCMVHSLETKKKLFVGDPKLKENALAANRKKILETKALIKKHYPKDEDIPKNVLNDLEPLKLYDNLWDAISGKQVLLALKPLKLVVNKYTGRVSLHTVCTAMYVGKDSDMDLDGVILKRREEEQEF